MYYYMCECGRKEFHGNPHYEDENVALCCDCAYEKGLMTDLEYIKSFYYGLFYDKDITNLKVIKKGVKHNYQLVTSYNHSRYEVVDTTEKRFKDRRNSQQYKNWRTSVFERDEYTCQRCNQVGGELNAHHIKPYKKYKELRLDLDNGITLCKKCHIKIHKRK